MYLPDSESFINDIGVVSICSHISYSVKTARVGSGMGHISIADVLQNASVDTV